MVAIDDHIYIKQVLDGQTSAYAFLVDKYKNMVYTVIHRIVRQNEDAEDLAQETFLKAFNKLHTFGGNAKFSTWLYTIAYRTAINKIQLKQVDLVQDEVLYEVADGPDFPQLQRLKEEEQRRYVRKAIDALPEVDGVVVTLYYMDDHSVQEIAQVTGLSEGNVKVKLHRARKQLKTVLSGLLQAEMKTLI